MLYLSGVGAGRPTIICAEYEGHITAEASKVFLPIFEDVLRVHGTYVHFGDTPQVKSYDPEFKNFGFRYYKRNGHLVQGVHYLVKSQATRLGMKLFQLAMGADFVHVYARRSAYEAKLEEALATAESHSGPGSD